MQTKVKSKNEIEIMREGGKMLASVLFELRTKYVVPGITTKELARHAASELQKFAGAEPTILGYQGFPDVICISVNDEVVHGIPRADRIITDGDIVSLDFCVSYRGLITDAAVSTIAGKPKQNRHVELIKNTEIALMTGISAVHDRVRTGDIGSSIEKFLKSKQYGIVRDLVGHGVGTEMHEDPNIPNYGRANTGPWLDKGMTIAIEPMVTLGRDDVVVAEDDWTILTKDGSWAAHFEHTIVITEDGAEILTQL
jgi:methionyl aminopeptidase